MELNLPGFNALLGLVDIFENGPDALFKMKQYRERVRSGKGEWKKSAYLMKQYK